MRSSPSRIFPWILVSGSGSVHLVGVLLCACSPRRVPVAVSRATVLGVVVPAPAAVDAALTRWGPSRVIARSLHFEKRKAPSLVPAVPSL